jgi:CRP-like cAMP-binding protein
MLDSFLSMNGLKDVDLLNFKWELTPLQIKKGSLFITYGQIIRHIALVEDGYLRTYHIDEDGNEVTTEFSSPETFCTSYYSFYTHEPAFEFIEAITDCQLQLLTYNSLQKLYSESFAMNVFGRTILEKACIERDLRLNKVTHMGAKEKYEWFLQTYPEIYKVAKLIHIASFLGINPETLSRVRRKIIS